MGRKKKITDNNNVFNVKFDRQLPNTPVVRDSAGGWINWGRRNNYPTQLLGLLSQSPTLTACVHFAVTSVLGGGVDWDSMQLDDSQMRPNYRYSWEELIKRCAYDYFALGNFAIQVVKNRDGKTYSFYHEPFEHVRYAKRDNDGLITSFYLSQDWTNPSKYKPIEIDSLTMRSDNQWKIPAGKPYLFVPEVYNQLTDVYPTPVWSSAQKAVQAETEFLSFDLRTASNIFAPAGALTLPTVDSEEEKQAILQKIQDMFSGADGAQQLLVSFRNDSEDEPVKFTPFTASTNNVDLFSTSNDRNIDRILTTFSIPSRSLIGLPLGNVGFSSESAILETSYLLYETLAGNAARRQVVGVINDCFKANGIDTEIVIKPLVFGTGESNNDAPSTEVSSDDNVEEQKQ